MESTTISQRRALSPVQIPSPATRETSPDTSEGEAENATGETSNDIPDDTVTDEADIGTASATVTGTLPFTPGAGGATLTAITACPQSTAPSPLPARCPTQPVRKTAPVWTRRSPTPSPSPNRRRHPDPYRHRAPPRRPPSFPATVIPWWQADAAGNAVTLTLVPNVDNTTWPAPSPITQARQHPLTLDSITVVATDADGSQAIASLPVTIIDAGPTVDDAAMLTLTTGEKINLMIVLDVSNSMFGPTAAGDGTVILADGNQTNFMALTKAAVVDLIHAYGSSLGEVMVARFGNTASVLSYNIDGTSSWQSTAVDITDSCGSREEAIRKIKDLGSGVGTNYNDALLKAEENYDKGLTAAEQTFVYFLSDGRSNTSGNEIDSTERANWVAFLEGKGIDEVYAIGLGNDFTDEQGLSHLGTVAWSSSDDEESDHGLEGRGNGFASATRYRHAAQLPTSWPFPMSLTSPHGCRSWFRRSAAICLRTTRPAPMGGACRPWVSVNHGNQTYTFDAAHLSYVIQTAVGTLTVSNDGLYTLMIPTDGTAEISYTIQDADGSTSTATLSLVVENGTARVVNWKGTVGPMSSMAAPAMTSCPARVATIFSSAALATIPSQAGMATTSCSEATATTPLTAGGGERFPAGRSRR